MSAPIANGQRLLGVIAAATLLILGTAFTGGVAIVQRRELRKADCALLAQATDEASHALTASGDLALGTDRQPYAAVYDEQGTPRGATAAFAGEAPRTSALHPARRPFDLALGDVQLRAVMVPIPGRPSATLLLAQPRDEASTYLLGRAMIGAVVLASAWCLVVAAWLVRRLGRAHREESSSLRAELERQKRFVAFAAHELRAPLTLVHGQLALALRRPRQADEYRDAIGEALDAASHLRTLTDDLLDLERTRAQGVGVETVAVARIARLGARHVHAAAQARLVSLEIRTAPAFVLGRAPDLERLVRNLLENAVRHSPLGGRVVLDVAWRDGHVELAVTDEGQGVAESERDRLFEPFFRGAAVREERGAGLGLAIVREVARAHGGDVRLDPTTEQGARFVVELPGAPAAQAATIPVATGLLYEPEAR